MDKLEKALQKARALREQELSGHPAPRTTRKERVTERPAPQKRPIHITDKQLEIARIVAHQPRGKEADTYRLLRTQVLQAMNQAELKSLAITSPNYGDGKTTTALNLAISIALDLNQTVLLVDLDLRKPSLHHRLGLKPEFGLGDHLQNNVPLSDCLIRLSFERLSILPAGEPMDYSSELLGLPKMADLADELKTRYPDRIIIYDMPPVLQQDDSLAFLPNVDAVLLVVREGVTKTGDVTRSLETLDKACVIGTVLNAHI